MVNIPHELLEAAGKFRHWATDLMLSEQEDKKVTQPLYHYTDATGRNFGAGGGLGLPIIGRLLGHTQASTTQRYAHLDADPLRKASDAIGGRIAAALEGKRAKVVALRG